MTTPLQGASYKAQAEDYFAKATNPDPVRDDPRQAAMLALTCAVFALLDRLEEQTTR